MNDCHTKLVVVLYHGDGDTAATEFCQACQASTETPFLEATKVEQTENLFSWQGEFLKAIDPANGEDRVADYAVAFFANDDRETLEANLPLEIGIWLALRSDHQLHMFSINPNDKSLRCPGPPREYKFGSVQPTCVDDGEKAFEIFLSRIQQSKELE